MSFLFFSSFFFFASFTGVEVDVDDARCMKRECIRIPQAHRASSVKRNPDVAGRKARDSPGVTVRRQSNLEKTRAK